ncbi:DUF6624 domain-containing protein [Chryseobacterium sp. ON_d1]|uniref:DUF6624 domain-containing protein n=1 Tax=Chryseobacterium sp. ON_d1 TaxID=2583211 RepID=UPI00115965CB|nr:DUF6624 domain-containing protein [Chryseobacterium sp. ON_d1]GEJ45866.1 hypothetical protein CRS_24740 [Chryseobacterium sp. ON_d1]
MKKYLIIIFLSFIALGCRSSQISDADKKTILDELNYIYTIDQKYAGLPFPELKEKYGEKKVWDVFLKMRDSVGLENQNRIKRLYEKYGYLGYDKIGEKETQFWISIQHADNDVLFQQEMLKVLKKEIRKKNADRSHYAMLEDRIAVNQKKKQRFGSQVTYNKIGQAIPKYGLVDSARVDKWRARYHLPSFKKYYNDMTVMHFEMNKDRLSKAGIHEPVLYK